jgi:hypothetical protein
MHAGFQLVASRGRDQIRGFVGGLNRSGFAANGTPRNLTTDPVAAGSIVVVPTIGPASIRTVGAAAVSPVASVGLALLPALQMRSAAAAIAGKMRAEYIILLWRLRVYRRRRWRPEPQPIATPERERESNEKFRAQLVDYASLYRGTYAKLYYYCLGY